MSDYTEMKTSDFFAQCKALLQRAKASPDLHDAGFTAHIDYVVVSLDTRAYAASAQVALTLTRPLISIGKTRNGMADVIFVHILKANGVSSPNSAKLCRFEADIVDTNISGNRLEMRSSTGVFTING